MGVVRHGIEELPFDVLCKRVGDLMRNAAENGQPVWDQSREAVANDLMEYDDQILACHVNDVLAAVSVAQEEHADYIAQCQSD